MAFAFSGAASAAPKDANSCPATFKNVLTAANVGAEFTTNGNTATYTFFSLVDEDPVNGVPGLVKYCVYPGNGAPTTIEASAEGANGADWTASKSSKYFRFMRPGGNKTNIPLDGTSTVIGTATWSSTPPASQTIVLHINDPAVCADIYGGDALSCFVFPSQGSLAELLCQRPATDLTDVVYTALPRDPINCPKSSLGFEAVQVKEFGDEVTLASTTGYLRSLSVVFSSYGCSESGKWYDGTCETSPGATFPVTITAKIYEESSLGLPGNLIEQKTETVNMAYRPSANPGACADDAKWYNPLNPEGDGCQSSISQLVTFNFSGTLPVTTNPVIWTVQFNTTHYGYSPIGEGAACYGVGGGCGYDSLNVGARTFTGSPYVGDAFDEEGTILNSSWSSAYCDGGFGGTDLLRVDTSLSCWGDFRPLGEIKVSP